MLHSYLSADHRGNKADGCIVASVATDFEQHPKARTVMTQHIKGVLAGFVKKFPWFPRRAKRKQAIQALALMVGGLMLSRVVDAPSLQRRSARHLWKASSTQREDAVMRVLSAGFPKPAKV